MMFDLFRGLFVSSVALMLFMIVYRLLIRHRVSFIAMRISLLSIFAAVCILPFLEFDWSPVALQYVLPSEIVSLDNFEIIGDHATIGQEVLKSVWTMSDILIAFYTVITLFLLLRLLRELFSIVSQILSNEVIQENNYKYILVKEPNQAAAFMNYIIISKAIWDSEDKLLIARHERAHVRQWHSIDRFLTEVLFVFQWMNPFIYWFRKDLTEVHEFLADQEVVNSGVDIITYQQLIAKYATMSLSLSLGNQLNHSLTLNRIKMIVQHKTLRNLTFYRSLSLVPVALILLCLFSFQQPLTPSDPTDGDYMLPIEEGLYWTSSEFGLREHPVTKTQKMHTGVDFVANSGTPVLAVQDAKVLRIQHSDEGYGNNIVLGIDGQISVLYGHLSKIRVAANQVVKKGEVIGAVGNTGKSMKPHLHFEVIDGKTKVDPKAYLPKYTFRKK